MRKTLAWLLLLAAAASIPRFGQRENEGAAISDSDYYLDMASVFTGAKAAFDPVWSAAGHTGAHHYARPLLPFVAGWSARVIPGLGVRAAFSVIDVLAAWVVAVLLYLLVLRTSPELRHPWVPGALFLTGFPQVDWGYHLLTDTVGYATAFAAAFAAWSLLHRRAIGAVEPAPTPPVGLALLGVFALQALALLARETAWIVPVFVVWLLVRDEEVRGRRGLGAALLVVLLLAAMPRLAYTRALDVRPISLPFDPAAWLDGGYALAFIVKSLVAFHVLWVLAALGVRGAGARAGAPGTAPWIPRPFEAWAVGGLLYMAAGYAHNTPEGSGYPLRLTWALFPAVLLLAARGTERLAGPRARAAALLLVALNAAIAVGGTLLDPGTGGISVTSPIRPEPPPRS